MNIDWQKEINNLEATELPEDGKGPPKREMFDYATYEGVGEFHKVTAEVFIYTDSRTKKTYTSERSFITEYGEVSLKDVLELILHLKKKKT